MHIKFNNNKDSSKAIILRSRPQDSNSISEGDISASEGAASDNLTSVLEGVLNEPIINILNAIDSNEVSDHNGFITQYTTRIGRISLKLKYFLLAVFGFLSMQNNTLLNNYSTHLNPV